MVAIINFGGQYAHLIARRVRELGIKSELVSPDIDIEDLKNLKPEALIFSGSPSSVYAPKAPRPNKKIYDLGIPILGICYGLQLMAYQLNGKVGNKEHKQFGKVRLKLRSSDLFRGLANEETVWFSHGDQAIKAPSNFKIIASSKNASIAGFENTKKNFFGIQFHPEVTHTKNGKKVLTNFLFIISKVQKDWDVKKRVGEIINDLREQLLGQKVVMAISGGVDSLVAATILQRAIGINLYAVFIDTGLLRKDEASEVLKIIKSTKINNFKKVDASKDFLNALKGITDPEKKRKVISQVYFSIFEKQAKKIGDVKYLGQGTIYPDRIESASTSAHADKIKSHHNLTLPSGLKLKIVEPLGEFYKDEVRKIGELLKIKKEFLYRHPFPGPALAIRILGDVTPERLDILREADAIFIEEIKNNNIYGKVGQAFAALFPVKSVGVMGDARTYEYIVSLRSVDTSDFMTADWSKIPNDILEKVSSRIVNEVRGVNRVVYDITQKPPATIEYE